MSFPVKARKAVFVLATTALAAGAAYFSAARAPPRYEASLHFQLAVPPGGEKISLKAEKHLLQSDALLMQVVKDLHLMPDAAGAKFRGLDLGPQYGVDKDHAEKTFLHAFRKNFDVDIVDESAMIGLSYRDANPQQAQAIIEGVFEKFSGWRQTAKESKFDKNAIESDRHLADMREAFLKSQSTLLKALEAGKTPEKPAQDARRKAADAKVAALKERYGPKHPALIEAIEEQKEIYAETQGAPTVSAPNEGRVAQLRSQMEKDFQKLDLAIRQSVVTEQNKTEPLFRILPLDEVRVEQMPDYLRMKTALAALMGFLLSCLYLVLRGQPVINNRRQLERIGDYTVFGHIKGLLKGKKEDLPLPAGATADGIKSLRHELKLRGDNAKLVTVTSSLPEEGRGELVAGLGRLAARGGEKVLIIDADLRSPTLQKKIPLKFARNLVDYLSGQARLEDIIVRTDPSGVHVIYGTAIPNTALDLLSSDKMKNLLTSLRQAYDLVLVQAPVALRGPDARVLASLSDRTLYLVRGGHALQKNVRTGIAAFQESGIKTLSFVLIDN